MTDTKDSNPKQAFGDAKVPVGLVPDTVIIEMALALLEGALKYGGYNYRVVGVKASTYNHAMERHRKKWWNGQDRDPATKVRELASVMACCAILIDAEICGMLTDDRPPVAPVGDQLDANMEIVAHLKELFKDHNPKQFTWEDSPGLQHLKEPAPQGFPDGYSAESGTLPLAPDALEQYRLANLTHETLGDGTHEGPFDGCMRCNPPTVLDRAVDVLARAQDAGHLALACGCTKRCKGHAVTEAAARVDAADGPGNYAAERAAGPKDPQGRPYATTTADAEFPLAPPVHRPVEAAREFDPAD